MTTIKNIIISLAIILSFGFSNQNLMARDNTGLIFGTIVGAAMGGSTGETENLVVGAAGGALIGAIIDEANEHSCNSIYCPHSHNHHYKHHYHPQPRKQVIIYDRRDAPRTIIINRDHHPPKHHQRKQSPRYHQRKHNRR